MKTGADWYPRDPQKFLMGCMGLTAKEIAVYQITTDLMYANAGECPNEPKFIAGFIHDMGAAAVRKSLESLMEKGKVYVTENNRLSNETVQKLAKTREETKEKRRISGKKGGKKSSETRAKAKENNGIGEPNASTPVQPDKIRLDNKEKEIQKDFDLFWAAYPKSTRKSGKVDAMMQFSKIVNGNHSKQEKTTAEQIIMGAKNYARSIDPQFVKAPTAWLNAGMWEVDAPSQNELRVNGARSKAETYRRMK